MVIGYPAKEKVVRILQKDLEEVFSLAGEV